MTIEEYFGGWVNVLDLNEVKRITTLLAASKEQICPSLSNTFKAFHLCDYHNVRCIVLGMDPYPNYIDEHPVATGIAFANASGTDDLHLSPSLQILKESFIDYTIPHESIIFDPSLKFLEEQGVLLLNSALTCKKGAIGSHALLWRQFMIDFLRKMSKSVGGIVYVLLGSYAQSFEKCIDSRFSFILKEKHPAWYWRNEKSMPSDTWVKVNKILSKQNGDCIKWFSDSYEYGSQ